jgi:hypothetical protein
VIAVNEEQWARARQARDALAAELLGRAEVTMIDIGEDEAQDTLVLRVHIRGPAEALAELPREFDRIPVQVVYGDYRPDEAGP